MAAEARVDVKVGGTEKLPLIRREISEFEAVLRKIASKKYQLQVEAAGTEIAAKNLAYLTSSAAKYDAQLKASEASAKRFANALQSQMQAEQNAAKAREGLASSLNGYDQALKKSEAAAKSFSAALRQQMQAEMEYYNARRDMASSMTVIDRAIQANEKAAANFSNALQARMTKIQTAEQVWASEQAAAQRSVDGMMAAQSAIQGTGSAAAATAKELYAVKVALGTLVSHAVMLAIRKMTQAVREALSEMKNVDTELTNISKVSGKTGKELEAIGDAAYETATKYGVAASEYLQAVYAMQKAGMGDNSEAMGELAVKTMLVGDTTQDVATKFLLATNAAWKLEGNMERLGQIVDEADYINNNYATSLDKLAAGMPIVASVAENAGMSAEETMAALGTITAATQESGTKAATALRALILNISKEVGTFITDEGEEFKITEESIKTVQGLLEKYAKAEVDAAKASGELLDPMTAIRALFKGMAEDDLSDVELFNLLSGMGGKLRTNQLTALVKNFETLYTDMMGNIADAAGTADSEIDLMMNSWEKKSQVLKNTWTKLIADILDSNTVKGALDTLTGVLDKTDELVQKLQDPFYEVGKTGDKIAELQGEIDLLIKKMASGELTKADETRLSILKEQLEVLRLQQKAEDEMAYKKLQEQLTKRNTFTGLSLDDQNMAALKTDAAKAGADFTGDVEKYRENLAGVVKQYQEYYDNVIKVRDAGVSLTDSQKTFIKDFETIRSVAGNTSLSLGELVDGFYEIVDAQGNVLARVEKTKTIADVFEELRQRQVELNEAQAAFDNETDVDKKTEAYLKLQDAQKAYDDALKAATDKTDGMVMSEYDATEAAGETASAAAEIAPKVDTATESANKLAAAFSLAAAAASGISISLPAMDHQASGTRNAPGGPTLVNELGPEIISDRGRAYIANGGRPGIVNLSRGAVVLNAQETQDALNGGGNGRSIPAFATGTNVLGGDTSRKPFNFALTATGNSVHLVGTYKDPTNPLDLRLNGPTRTTTKKGTDTVISTVKKSGKKSGGGSGSGGGGGGSTEKSVETLAKETKDILSNIEKQAKLADNRKQYDKEAELWEKGQKEIDKMVAQYKKAGYKETDDEVLDLLNKRYDYEKKKEAASKKSIEEAAGELKDKLSNLDKQAKLADTNGDYKKEVQFYEQAQEAIKEMVDKYRKAGYKDDSDEIVDLLQKNVDYAEKQVKVYKDRWNDLIDALEADTEAQEAANALAEKEQALADARQALENATKQRTVRTYNAATGQWEWVADQSKIKTAQESLTKAEENYSKEVKDQAISELEHLRDTMADLNNVVLGPALSAIMSQAESSDTFQNFARALNAVYGVGTYLSSTAGSSKVLSTADSHDTIYTFGNVTLTEEEASSMSVAQLAQRLQVLKIS
jgi:TP901 family phage tail tape measure protein